jgi:hypothetical protein
LACKWIVSGYGVVPMEFEKLINKLLDEGDLKAVISELLRREKEKAGCQTYTFHGQILIYFV